MGLKNVIKNWTAGADFELFLLDDKEHKVINAKPYVKGTKRKPFNFDKENKFWCTSLDGVSMEGNIPPVTTAEEFDRAIKKVIDYMNSTLPEGLRTIHEPAIYMDEEQLKTKEARHFGCDPSFSAYNLQAPTHIPDARSTTLRTCCTHVHVRYDDMNIDTSVELIKAMDIFLGLPSLLIEPINPRRTLYGRCGEFRFDEARTTEYRVLSSFFSQSEDLRKWVFNNTVKAIDWINEGNRVSEQQGEQFQQAMNSNDLEYAKILVEEFNVPMPI